MAVSVRRHHRFPRRRHPEAGRRRLWLAFGRADHVADTAPNFAIDGPASFHVLEGSVTVGAVSASDASRDGAGRRRDLFAGRG
ncbi:hypothetical protein AB5I41_10865 [Sphingomonas sp. MMS24-JH45]